MYYYLEQSRLSEEDPWESKQYFVIASGDDTVLYIWPDWAARASNTILLLTTRDKNI